MNVDQFRAIVFKYTLQEDTEEQAREDQEQILEGVCEKLYQICDEKAELAQLKNQDSVARLFH